jgi:hypothetical protein
MYTRPMPIGSCGQGLNCQKISGVDICLFIVIVITHRQFSIINNGGGIETDPPGYHVWGVKQTTGGFNPQPPGNSNTGCGTVTVEYSLSVVKVIVASLLSSQSRLERPFCTFCIPVCSGLLTITHNRHLGLTLEMSGN